MKRYKKINDYFNYRMNANSWKKKKNVKYDWKVLNIGAIYFRYYLN